MAIKITKIELIDKLAEKSAQAELERAILTVLDNIFKPKNNKNKA